MTNINLLPWREKKREKDKKNFLFMVLSGVATACVIVILINSYATHLITNQNMRNEFMQKEITFLDAQIKEIKVIKQTREALVARMSIVQNLQSTRTLMVHLFDELIKVMTSGLYVSKLERKNDIVTLWGFSESNSNISDLMRNMEANDWIASPVLSEIKKMQDKKQPANNEFTLSFVLKSKSFAGGKS